MTRQTHLKNRRGQYYFRYAIPFGIQHRFSCKEFTYSLKTRDYHEAKAKVGVLLAMAEVIMKTVKDGRLTPAQAREVARQYFKLCLERLEKQFNVAERHSIHRAKAGPYKGPQYVTGDGPTKGMLIVGTEDVPLQAAPHFPITKGLDYLLPPEIDLTLDGDEALIMGKYMSMPNKAELAAETGWQVEHRISDNRVKESINPNVIYQYCQKKYGLEGIVPDTLSYQTFTTAIDRAITELKNVHKQYLGHEADVKINDDWFRDVQAAPQKTLPLPSGMPLKELITDFISERMRGENWTDRTKKDRQAQFALLSEVLGDSFDTASLDAKKAAEVKRMLQELPKNRSKNPKTRGLSLKDSLIVKDVEKLDTRTVNEYLMAYQSLFGWAETQGHIEKSAFKGLGIQQKKSSLNDRDAFSRDQIKVILTALPEHTPEKSGKSFQYWGVMIAIYTGARLNEIAQLTLDDIRQENDVWYFDLNDEGEDKQLKNVQSKRRVPIHAALISCGILEHVQTLRTQGHKRLFPDLNHMKGHGYGRYLARWVNENFLVALGIKAKGLSFHSFRHSFITNLRQSVDLQTVQEIVGHDKGVVTETVYNHSYDLQQLKTAIDKLIYC